MVPTTILESLHKLPLHPLSLILFLSFIFLSIWLSISHANNRNTPPSPPKLPILGNLHQLDKLLHRSLKSFSEKYGDVMLIYIGSKPTLVVSSADAAQEIMKTHDITFANRPKLMVASTILYDGKDMAFAKYGEYWRQMKSLCMLNLFSNTKVRSFQHEREEEVGLMVEEIRAFAAAMKPVNLSDMFTRIANDFVCRAAFGRKYAGEEGCANLTELLSDFSEALGTFCMQDFIPWLGWIDRLSGVERKAKRVAKVLDDFIEKIVQEHLDSMNIQEHVKAGNGAEKVQYLVDILLEVQRENSSSLPRESIKAILMDIIAGGTDTTYTLLEWAMTELLRNPAVMKQLQDEVRGAVKLSSKPGVYEDDLKNMNYLKAVIKETLRLHPPLPLLLFREPSEDVKIKGYDIAAGTQVIINAWAIQTDSGNWENPDEFRPERFLNSAFDFKGQDFRYIPFGAGRRGCPGLPFAIVDAELVLANLVCEFDWKFVYDAEGEAHCVAENAGTTVRRKDPLLAVPTPFCCM